MDELAKRFAELAEKYGPNVYDAAMSAVRIEAYSTLVGSFISAGFAVALFLAGRWLSRVECREHYDNDFVHPIGYIAIGLSVLPLAFFIWTWINPWTWIAINHPELYLAKKVFHL